LEQKGCQPTLGGPFPSPLLPFSPPSPPPLSPPPEAAEAECCAKVGGITPPPPEGVWETPWLRTILVQAARAKDVTVTLEPDHVQLVYDVGTVFYKQNVANCIILMFAMTRCLLTSLTMHVICRDRYCVILIVMIWKNQKT